MKLEETLKGLDKEVDIFKMKEKMTLEESKINVEKLNKISVSLEAAVKEIEVCAWNCVLNEHEIMDSKKALKKYA